MNVGSKAMGCGVDRVATVKMQDQDNVQAVPGFMQAGAMQYCQTDSCRMAGTSKI
jgi:hypothetical protein